MKRRSFTKPPPSDPNAWVFFTDRDLGKRLPNALRAAGYDVRLHDDVFPDPRTKDVTWLPQVAAQGWIALSADRRQRRVKLERDVAMNAGVAIFYLSGKNHDEVIANLIATVPRIIRFREKHKPPFMARVTRPEAKFVVGTRPGNIEMKLTEAQWREMLAQGG